MQIERVRDLAIPEVKIVEYSRFLDDRGYFTEVFRDAQIAEALGVAEFRVVQANESFSRAGVFRGLHAQWNPYQGKLVRSMVGRLLDVALDLRKGSPTFGRVIAREMRGRREADASEWIWLPPGFAHGTLLTEDSIVQYLCTGAWSPGCELSVSPLADDLDWSLCEPDLKDEILRHLHGGAGLNEKDRNGLTLAAWVADPRSDCFVHAPGEPWDVASRVG